MITPIARVCFDEAYDFSPNSRIDSYISQAEACWETDNLADARYHLCIAMWLNLSTTVLPHMEGTKKACGDAIAMLSHGAMFLLEADGMSIKQQDAYLDLPEVWQEPLSAARRRIFGND